MDQQQRHVSSGTTNPVAVLRFSTGRAFPFARLIAASRRRLFLSDCADHRSDDDGDSDADAGECAYSRAVLVLDMVWNLAFVVAAAGVLLSTLRERPATPLRLWLCGYAFECVLHMAFVYFEFRTRIRDSFSHTTYSIVKKLEPMNTLASSVWWVFGFYWIVVGGQALLEDSPHLYWLTVVFLAFDVFFIIFCIGMACIVFFALFCIIPIIALAYAMRIREGASEEDILSLPMYRFSQSNSLVMVDDNKKQLIKGRVDSCNGSHMSALSLHPDDSECCICLCPYVEGAELYRLPCTHHFHCECIGRWLQTKATCPLFFNFFILEGGHLPFFLNLRFRRSLFRLNLIFFASFILSFCSSLSFTFDSNGSFSTEAPLSFSLSAGGGGGDPPSTAELASSAAAETITDSVLLLGVEIRTPFKGFGGRITFALEAEVVGRAKVEEEGSNGEWRGESVKELKERRAMFVWGKEMKKRIRIGI